MAVLSVAGVVSTRGAPKKLGSSPDITHALRELLTSAYIVAEIQNMCNEKQIRLRISIFSITQHKKCEYRQNNSAISVIALFHPTFIVENITNTYQRTLQGSRMGKYDSLKLLG